MAKTRQEIINDITNHFPQIPYQDCYIGVASDIMDKMFGHHNVSREKGRWIYRPVSSLDMAREVARHFLQQGMDGGPGAGPAGGNEDQDHVHVYAYQKNAGTRP